MIVDTSALLALAFGEPAAGDIFDALSRPEIKRSSAANLFEAFAVADRRGLPDAVSLLEDSIQRFGIVVEPVTRNQVEIARSAWNTFGRGSGHSARINFGDCFAYALAKERDEAVLFIGDDFSHTNVVAVLET